MKEKKEILKDIDDFFNNRVHADKVQDVIQTLSDEKFRGEIVEIMKKHWWEENNRDLSEEKEYNLLLNRIHHRINILEEKKSGKKTYCLYRLISKVAAVLFLSLLVASAYFLVNNYRGNKNEMPVTYNEIFTPLAAKVKFLLPDSTVVWLNSGSTLKYPLSFTGKRREVCLTGEGYFDVKSNLDKPFVVQTKKMDVIAHGTSFDVMAYPDDAKVLATLVEGKLKVVKKSSGKYYKLNPSYQAELDSITGNMTVLQVEPFYYTSWKDGKLIFRKESMEMVANKLERWFNYKIYIENDQLRKYKYTGTIEMETLREVLELIKITTPVNYTYNKNTREIWIKPI